MSFTKLLCSVVSLALSAPFVKADGNCQAMLRPLANQTFPFTLTTHQSNHVVSFTKGNIQLGVYGSFPQYFSDRLNGAQPFSAASADRLGVSIDPSRSTLTTTLETWGNGRSSIDLLCVPGTSLLRGTSGNAEVVLMVGNGQTVAPPPSIGVTSAGPLPAFNGPRPPVTVGRGGRGCGKCDSVDSVSIPSVAADTDASAATALDALRFLSRSDPQWINRYLQQESGLSSTAQKLAYRVQAIDFLAKIVSH